MTEARPPINSIICGDCWKIMQDWPDEFIDCVVTSPPYWGLRDYGIEGQLGLEKTPEKYISKMVTLFREVRRLLKKTGTLWLNMGDSYIGGGRAGTGKHAYGGLEKGLSDCGLKYGLPTGEVPGFKPKDMCMMPHRLAIALQADGWWIRSDIVWHKPNPMPESCTDRPTKSHEYFFLCTKSGNPLTWTNNRMGTGTSIKPPGTKGVENEDWEWTEHSACDGKGCGKKRCVNGMIKSSLWVSHDYYYDADAIREESESGTSDVKKMIESKERIGGKHKDLDDKLSKASKHTNIGQKRAVGDPAGRNKRSVWTVPTAPYPEAHFATFPPKLIEPCILAGCPEWVCKKCGKARERIVEKSGGTTGQSWHDHSDDMGKGNAKKQTGAEFKTYKVEETGWTDCGCNAGFEGGIVFDPFMGSGTTAVVAYENNRQYLGCELKQEYIDMGRIEKVKANYGLLENG